MEPNKLEKHIKKQFQEREIEPSKEAWTRLSEQLSTNAPQNKKPVALWYGIAASVIGLLVATMIYLNYTSDVNTEQDTIVESNEDVKERIESNKKHIENKIPEVVDNSSEIQNSNKDLEIEKEIELVENTNKEVSDIEIVIENSVVYQDEKEEQINNKVLELLVTADSLEKFNNALTDAEVDDLLRQAQEQLLTDKHFSQDALSATALLNEVEEELDQSFRDKIFETLKSRFLKIRTAVADRNQ